MALNCEKEMITKEFMLLILEIKNKIILIQSYITIKIFETSPQVSLRRTVDNNPIF